MKIHLKNRKKIVRIFFIFLTLFFLFTTSSQCEVQKVLSTGLAKIFNSNIERARRSAIRQAYAEAVGIGAGMQIGSMTVVKNFQLISDIVTSGSNGFIKQFSIIDEGLSKLHAEHYFVKMEAEILEGAEIGGSSKEGLRAYLDLLENPKIIVFLTESQFSIPGIGKQQKVSTSGGLRAAETELAEALMDFGYQVISSDEILAEGYVDSQELEKARMGSTAYLVKVARIVGADVIINGMIRIDHKEISPAGVKLQMIGADFTSKTILASAKKKVNVMHITERRSHPEVTEAYIETLDRLTKRLADSIAWELPNILAKEYRQTSLIIENIDIASSQKIRSALMKESEIESVKLVHLPTKRNNQKAGLELYTGFIRLSSEELLSICKNVMKKKFNLLGETKYSIDIEMR